MTPRTLRRLLAGLLLTCLAWALVQGALSSGWDAHEVVESAEALADGEDEGAMPLLLVAPPPSSAVGTAEFPRGAGWLADDRPEGPAEVGEREERAGRAPPGGRAAAA